MRDIKDFDLKELELFLGKEGFPAYHARQIFVWVYQKGVHDFGSMSNIPLGLREKLKENFNVEGLKVVERRISKDGTEKFVFKLWDRHFIEAVRIPTKTRITVCLSSQVGCKFACRFCASGVSGFKRNLSCGEILEQIRGKPTHVVFMGTGEPLDNYDTVLKAIRIINSDYSFNIGARRITISTCGMIPGIKRLAEEALQVELSVSLHAAEDSLRTRLMPINKKYPLKELMLACEEYIKRTGRQITFEYILMKGINSDLQNAERLSKILKSVRLCKVNLIPSNSIEELKIGPPEQVKITLFRNYLLKKNILVTLRRGRGEDIEAACGQLRLRYEK